ncbi:type VII secretion protein EccCa [Streptomyces sp. NPDC001744]|uniref:type VII secretion protein EccCa n=1 Tax=Streptomyces sp. NPDC001744 TaxID=3364606 RepID=UPI0036A03293
MSTVLFRRPARRRGPDMPDGELALQEPPTLPEAEPNTSAMWTYLPMGLTSLAMLMMFLRPGQANAFSYVAIGLMLVSSVAMVLAQLIRTAGERKRKLKGERRDYLRYLTQMRRRIRVTVGEQQKALSWRHPDPSALWALTGTSRQWERRPADDDFAEVRVAVGDQKLAVRLAPLATKPVEDLEPLAAHALRSFIRAYGTVPDQPIALYLRAWSRVLVREEGAGSGTDGTGPGAAADGGSGTDGTGPGAAADGGSGTDGTGAQAGGRAGSGGEGERSRALLRALVAQLAAFHAPEELNVALCVSDERRADWEWLKWLPHAQHGYQRDGAGQARLAAADFPSLEELLGADFTQRPPFDPETPPSRDEPFVLVVVDGGTVPPGHRVTGPGYRNTVLVDLGGALPWKPARATLRLRLDGAGLHLVRTDRERKEQATFLGRPDALGPAAARALAARLSPYRLGGGVTASEPFVTDTDLTSLLGITDLRKHEPDRLWKHPVEGRGRLRVPIAVGEDGTPVELDIKESAQGGMGPHGMLIGATGSGKSELLRTLVLGLALTHSSETLNFVLVDFKGGATFLGMDELPHTSAVITNLADEVALVARMQDALHGELIRRQELLRKAGNYASVLEYERARAAGTPLAPLPSLFVVVDEFSELLAAHRDFMELFVMIGRLGRSLGVHLLLASQRLEEGRMSALEGHLSYRIGLRTFSAIESRGVLGVPDAYHLPSQPGSGYLKSGVEALTRFRAAYVSGPYKAPRRTVRREQIARQVVSWGTEWIVPHTLPAAPDPEPETEPDTEESLLALALGRLRDSGPPAHQVWLPPLDRAPSLDALLPPLTPDPDLGLTTAGFADRGRLRVPVGLVDRPFEQVRDLLTVDLSGAGGHFAVAGGPQSGKSTLLRTLICSLALTHSPREVQFYCMDFGGGALGALAGLPHVGGVAGRLDRERIARTFAEILSLLNRRELFFQEQGIDSMTAYRKRRAAGEFADQPFGDVFLVVDGWSTVRSDFFDDIAVFGEIATRGLNYGVHLVISTARWVELSSALRDQIGTRLELRMGDPMDSDVDVRKAGTVPVSPGRGLSPDKLHFLTALPRIDGQERSEDLAEAVADLVEAVAESWDAPPAPAVRMLPTRLALAELPVSESPLRISIGLDETELAPVWHDFAQSPHLYIIGDTESGKTAALRMIAQRIMQTHGPDRASFLIADYRRELVGAIPEEYRLGHAISADPLREYVDGVARAMTSRLPGEDITPARMRRADWWNGPRLFVLVDDYEMVGSPFDGPFDSLLPHLPLGYEIGLHFVVARASTGAGRSDPLVHKLGEVNSSALLLSCPPSEGYLLDGIKPRILPPGRAQSVVRRKTRLVHLALPDPEENEEAG